MARIKDLSTTTSLVDTDKFALDRVSPDETLNTTLATIKSNLQSSYDTRYAIKDNCAPPLGVIFDGVDDYYQVADNPNLNFGTGDFSIVWYLTPSDRGHTTSIGKIAFNALSWNLGIRNDDLYKNPYFRIYDNTAVPYVVEPDVNYRLQMINKKSFIVVTRQNNNIKIYLNGLLIADKYNDKYAGSVTNSVPLGFNYIASTPQTQPNKLYLVQFYNRALSESEVTQLYNNGMPHLAELPYADRNANQTILTSGTLQYGKRYRIDNYVSGDDFTNVGASSNATGIVFVATGTTPTNWTNGSSLRQIGCVAEYKSENAGTMGWIETQNGLHAISSGNPVAPVALRDYKSGISITTVQFVNSQKAQTILKQIVVKNNYAGSNTVSLGTTTNANELVNNVALANGETKIIDVNSYSATERSLYCKAGASNIDVTLIFDKVAR